MSSTQKNNTVKTMKPLLFRGFIAFVCYFLAYMAFYNQVAVGTFYPYDSVAEMLFNLVLNFTPMLLLLVFDTLIVFKLVRISNVTLKIIIDFLFTLVAVVCVNLFYLLIFKGLTFGHLDWAGTIFNNFVMFLAVEAFYYVRRFLDQQRVMESQRQEVEKKRQEVLKYQYDALKAQVNPHFLFNSLSILTSLIDIDKTKAQDYVTWLSQVYRYIMSKQDVELSSLTEELDFIQSYSSILGMRYHEKFNIHITGEEHVRDQMLVPFTLQILVENITKHNVISSKQPMTVELCINSDGIVISNPIRLRTSVSASHFGLRYLTTLYSTYGLAFRTENDGETFSAYIPYIKKP